MHNSRRGLSLCIQGTSEYSAYLLQLKRFIPVHTGNIGNIFNLYLEYSVYPCAYREHILCLLTRLQNNGLSLCIQGTWLRMSKLIEVLTVYPCAYREHKFLSKSQFFKCGLSLCIQGTWHWDSATVALSRFIPVHTGNIVC